MSAFRFLDRGESMRVRVDNQLYLVQRTSNGGLSFAAAEYGSTGAIRWKPVTPSGRLAEHLSKIAEASRAPADDDDNTSYDDLFDAPIHNASQRLTRQPGHDLKPRGMTQLRGLTTYPVQGMDPDDSDPRANHLRWAYPM